MTAIPSNKLTTTHPIAAADYFGKNWLTRKLTWFFTNAILISRGKTAEENPQKAIEIMSDLVKSGKSIIIFPEGSRGTPGKLQKFKKGIGYVVQRNRNTPVIPVYMDGIGRILPKGKKIMLPYITKIYFGQPLYFSEETPQEINARIEQEVLLLQEKCMKASVFNQAR
jgi:1-acyl-sn-glycerol-3-phosphate acyltransferase